MSSMSEEDLFKTLLKNKPPQKIQIGQKTQVPVRIEIIKPVPAAQPVETYEKESPVIQTPVIQTYKTPDVNPLENELVVESIKNLTASVNTMHGLMKSVIVPVLVLILIVEIMVLIKLR